MNSVRNLLDILSNVESNGSSENCILTIISESGAGGTTYAKFLAFQASLQGYPTLVAKPGLTHPVAMELSRFLYRAHIAAAQLCDSTGNALELAAGERESFETPWLLVFDVSHWEGRQTELRSFLRSFTADGRAVVILTVQSPFAPVDINKSWRTRYIAKLRHEMEMGEAMNLGEHLNKFLKPLGKPRSKSQWQQFWEAHKPDYITSSIAHFWIALEFWLKGQLDLNQSIQSWLFQSFKDAQMTDDLRIVVLEIAAMTIERQPLPEALIPPAENQRYPYSFLLEEVSMAVPALALVRESATGQKLWAMAHDLLGRYLITSVFFDRVLLTRLGLDGAKDPIQLRLALLQRVAWREVLALKPYRKLAVDFAIKIFKLDAQGNQEFVPYWREVLQILGKMPSGIRETSRAFNHHVAISLRRVVRQREFGIPHEERRLLLERAVAHVEYALYQLDRDFEDGESDLNLYNSLALAYQDLADVARESGSPIAEVEGFRTKATESTLKALQEDPTNSYVLETTAKNLIQNGELHAESAAASASEALGYIYQAVTFERSEYRQTELTRLANRAVSLLRKANSSDEVQRLVKTGNPLGVLAEAWLQLLEGVESIDEQDLSSMDPRNVSNALAILESSPGKSNWMVLRFRYDLVSASRPGDFATQLRLLDELDGTGFRMPLQVRLEHAILLHQEGRHMEGNRKFRGLRQDMRQADSIIEVPKRLFWLRDGIEGGRRICEAQVVDLAGQRAMAKVRELLNEPVPFIPQEFGVAVMRPGLKFKCWINFGFKGPFIKPPEIGGGRERTRHVN